MLRNGSVTEKPDASLSDRISQVMGQKLLQGFALLDEYCLHCNTPLMRDRNGTLFCVACKLEAAEKRGEQEIDIQIAPPASIPESSRDSSSQSVTEVVSGVLYAKLKLVALQLNETEDVSHSIELNILIKGLLESIKLLNEVK